MKVVNSLIFNALVERESINLPQIGSLRIERRSAALKSKKRLELPTTKVVYSKNETDGARSIVELIENESGADRAKAEELYGKWLEESQSDRVVTIEGVGRIKNDFFTPAPELAALINPEPKPFVKLERRVRPGMVAAIIVPLVVVLAAGYYLVFIQNVCENGFGFEWGSCDNVAKVEALVIPEPSVAMVSDSDSMAVVAVDSAVVTGKSAIEIGNQTQLTTQAETQTQQTQIQQTQAQAKSQVEKQSQGQTAQVQVASSISSVDLFHVIAGVYSSVENANKFISKSRLTADTLTYKILPVYNGKFLVSIFESPSEGQANKRRSVLKKADPNLWIFKAPAGSKN